MGENGLYVGYWLESLKATDNLEDLGTDGKIILNYKEVV
jgi:hypothetical protein